MSAPVMSGATIGHRALQRRVGVIVIGLVVDGGIRIRVREPRREWGAMCGAALRRAWNSDFRLGAGRGRGVHRVGGQEMCALSSWTVD